uniref:Uncharacterized protein n=2 Tax=Oryza TaxID=4527 RepID=A0A0E0QGI8_ORYRU
MEAPRYDCSLTEDGARDEDMPSLIFRTATIVSKIGQGEQGGALMFLCNGICTWRLPTSIMEMWSQRCLGNETHGEDGTSVRTPGDSGDTANGTLGWRRVAQPLDV